LRPLTPSVPPLRSVTVSCHSTLPTRPPPVSPAFLCVTGHLIDFLQRHLLTVIPVSRVGQIERFFMLLQQLIETSEASLSEDPGKLVHQLERMTLYCLAWSVGGLLEPECRVQFDEYLRSHDEANQMPEPEEGMTIYEYFLDPVSFEWTVWKPPEWVYPSAQKKLDFSNLLVPTMDSTRSMFLMENMHKLKRPTLLVGGSGTAKTSTAYMFLHGFDEHVMMNKIVNFSSATTPFMFQKTVEAQLDKRGGKNFGPPNGKKMTVLIDDISMPLVNNWGDQPTLEAVRIVVEQGYFTFLDKDKRGDFKVCEDLQYIGAMQHPGGGRNDIPNRLKSKFFIFNLVLPSITSINDIYGQMLTGRFTKKEFDKDAQSVVHCLTKATIGLWNEMKRKMLPTPAKFHYVFNMRELSRVFQGVLLTPKDTYMSGGGQMANGGVASHINENKTFSFAKAPVKEVIAGIWKHECERVFCDKLATGDDKHWYHTYFGKLMAEHFDEDVCESPFVEEGGLTNMVSFLREDVYDEDGVFVDYAPKVYEIGGTLDDIRDRVTHFMDRHNEEFPQKTLELVLFTDALMHMLRISRLVEMPRGSALLVGVGGSGKQSLTRLSAYIANAFCFQITLTKTYNTAALMEDLRTMYKSAGHQRKPTVFLFTESEIKDEIFLELVNSVLMTGEVAGLFAKDEMMAMTADLRPAFLIERPGVEESQSNVNAFFLDTARDNLHVVLCMSPLNPMFPLRARRFPGLVSGPTIDWFLPWSKEALVAVSTGFISGFKELQCSAEVRTGVMQHMGNVHAMVTEACDEYQRKLSRNVYQTPKSYLSFIQAYKHMYHEKLQEIEKKEYSINLGLEKLIGGAADVEAMKIVLADEQVKLDEATEATNIMLISLEKESAAATVEAAQVKDIAASCDADAIRIGGEKSACMADLAKAQPFVDEAETAIDSIKPAHIGEIKKLPKPADIIKLVFDGVLLLFREPLNPVVMEVLMVAKKDTPFIASSFIPHAMKVMGNTDFLKNVQEFGRVGKDQITEETIELLCPYMDLENFNPQVAKNASAAAEGLCTWVRAMKFYHEASKIVKPKLEALGIAEGQLDVANKALAAAQKRLAACKATLAALQATFEAQMAEKKRIEDGAMALQRKMTQASDLINGLASERVRWTEDSHTFESLKARLVGDCAVACAFVSYCGPFNQDFRSYLVHQ
jgi:dynein heavy chain